MFGGGGGGAETPGRGPAGKHPGGGGRGPCLPPGTLGDGGIEAGLGLGPAGSDGGGGPPRDGKFCVGRGVLGMGGGAPTPLSCLDGKFGRPLGRSGTLLRPPEGAPGSLGGPGELLTLLKELEPPVLPGGRMGARLGPESGGGKGKI